MIFHFCQKVELYGLLKQYIYISVYLHAHPYLLVHFIISFFSDWCLITCFSFLKLQLFLFSFFHCFSQCIFFGCKRSSCSICRYTEILVDRLIYRSGISFRDEATKKWGSFLTVFFCIVVCMCILSYRKKTRYSSDTLYA